MSVPLGLSPPNSSTEVAVQSEDRDPVNDYSLGEVVRAALRHRRTLSRAVLVCSALGTLVWSQTPRRYLSTSSLMAQSRRPQQALSGLAAQFGINLPQGEGGLSPAVYADLLRSRTILGDLVDTPFAGADGRRVQLAESYRVRGATPALRRDYTIKLLQKTLRVQADAKTGVIELAVPAPDPAIARAMNLRMIDLLNTFNLVTRQSQAAAERRFTERRLADVRADLRTAENRLQAFLQENREFRGSPELTFAQDRLVRDVGVQQQLFTTLTQAFEQAKIEEVRDTPVITVLQRPEIPLIPETRGSVLKIGGGALVGLILGLVLAIVRDARLRAASSRAEDPASADALWADVSADLRRPWRLVFGRARELTTTAG